jgi:hypothetical protein
MFHFSDRISIKVDKEKNSVRVSIRITEDLVSVFSFSLSEFQKAVDQFNAQIKG